MAALRATSVLLFVALTACSVGEVPAGGATPPPDASTGTPDAPGTGVDGAVGTPDGPPVSGNNASFAEKVRPIVTKTIEGKMCTQGGCHVPGGQKPDFSSYDTLLPEYTKKPGNTSKLVTHGAHAGPALPDPDKATIITWINSLP
jgi:hypothetical protein